MNANPLWRKQIDDLLIPYPEKRQLLGELEDHFEHSGESDDEGFAEGALNEFLAIHNNDILLILRKLPPAVRHAIELVFVGGPLTGLLIFLIKEDFMIQFFKNGGAAMIPILAIGLMMLGREALLFLRVAMLRDHTKANLNVDSSSVLVGTLALIVVGLGAACIGIYVSISAAAASQVPSSLVMMGVGESITNVIVSTALAALVLMLHYTTRKLLFFWKAPVAQ